MKHNRAFSLVELSIVLVILGLLVGGILAGKSLIHAAELRSITQDYQKYKTAVYTFRDKYFALPGDMSNATSFWGTRSPCTADGVGTCNGNNDGKLFYSSEKWYMWEHLSLAGLIEGEYTGAWGPGGVYDTVPNVNAPASKDGLTVWTAEDIGTSAGNSNMIAGSYGNPFFFVGDSGLGTLKTEDAWNIDTKLDDGRPSFGKVMAYRYAGCIDTSTANPFPDAVYNLDSTTAVCALIFPYGVGG